MRPVPEAQVCPPDCAAFGAGAAAGSVVRCWGAGEWECGVGGVEIVVVGDGVVGTEAARLPVAAVVVWAVVRVVWVDVGVGVVIVPATLTAVVVVLLLLLLLLWWCCVSATRLERLVLASFRVWVTVLC